MQTGSSSRRTVSIRTAAEGICSAGAASSARGGRQAGALAWAHEHALRSGCARSTGTCLVRACSWARARAHARTRARFIAACMRRARHARKARRSGCVARRTWEAGPRFPRCRPAAARARVRRHAAPDTRIAVRGWARGLRARFDTRAGAHRQRTTGRGSTTRPPRTPRRAFFICDGGVNLRIPPPPRCSHSRPPPRLLGLHDHGRGLLHELVTSSWSIGPCCGTVSQNPSRWRSGQGRAVRVSRAGREARRPGAARMGHADASRAH